MRRYSCSNFFPIFTVIITVKTGFSIFICFSTALPFHLLESETFLNPFLFPHSQPSLLISPLVGVHYLTTLPGPAPSWPSFGLWASFTCPCLFSQPDSSHIAAFQPDRLYEDWEADRGGSLKFMLARERVTQFSPLFFSPSAVRNSFTSQKRHPSPSSPWHLFQILGEISLGICFLIRLAVCEVCAKTWRETSVLNACMITHFFIVVHM